MRIDVHAHYFTGDYLDLMARGGLSPSDLAPSRAATHPDEAADLAERFATMDRAGVTVQVLSVGAMAPAFADEALAVGGAEMANGLYADLAQRHPGRLAYFATVPLPHVDRSLEALRILDGDSHVLKSG